MSQIQISNLTFGYDGSHDLVFDNISLRLDTNWKTGLVGRNGRGKTTLLQLLLGNLEYRGTISCAVPFSYFPFQVSDPSQLTIDLVEPLLEGGERWQLERELSLLHVEGNDILYRPFYTLSQGEQTKTLLAALFLQEGRFLLIDEPTNHLDLPAREVVSRYLRAKSGFLLVSHDRAFLDACVDHIVAIHKTGLEIQRGNFSSWKQNKDQQDALEQSQNRQLKKEIHRLQEAARRTATWSDQVEKTKKGNRNSGLHPDTGYIGHKAAKMMKRSQSVESRQKKAIAEKESLLRNLETAEELTIRPLAYPQNRFVEVRDLSVCYGDRALFQPLSFSIRQGDRIAIQGPNGCGKSSLLSLLVGQAIPYRGTYTIGSQLVLSYVPQDTSFLSGSLDDFLQAHAIDQTRCKTILRKLDFSRSQFARDMSTFSAGQKKKVLLAKSLCESAHLYLWDEPLNYIDLLSRIQIEELLKDHSATMLFVEHDRSFVEKTATQILPLLFP